MADTQRGVQYTLKVRADSSVKTVTKAVADEIERVRKQCELQLKMDPRGFKTGWEQVEAAQRAHEAKVTGAATAGNAARAAAAAKAAEKEEAAAATVLERIAIRRKAAASKAAEADERYAEKVRKMAEAANEFVDNEQRKATAAREKELQRTSDLHQRALDKQKAADKKYWDEFVRFGQKSGEQRRKQEENDAELTLRKREEALHGVRDSALEAARASAELARGFALLGLVGEDSLGSIRDSLLKIQSGVDILRGGIDVARNLGEARRHYAAAQAGGASAGPQSFGNMITGAALAHPLLLQLAAAGALIGGAAKIAADKIVHEVEAAETRSREVRSRELEARRNFVEQLQATHAAEVEKRRQLADVQATANRLNNEFGPNRRKFEAQAAAEGLTGANARTKADSLARQANAKDRLDALRKEREELEAQHAQERGRLESSARSNFRAESGRRLNELDAEDAADRGVIPWLKGAFSSPFSGLKNLVGGQFEEQPEEKRRRERESIMRGLEADRAREARGEGFGQGPDVEIEARHSQEMADNARRMVEAEEEAARARIEADRIDIETAQKRITAAEEMVSKDRERVKAAKEAVEAMLEAKRSLMGGL